jgi:hypothetical protein
MVIRAHAQGTVLSLSLSGKKTNFLRLLMKQKIA